MNVMQAFKKLDVCIKITIEYSWKINSTDLYTL